MNRISIHICTLTGNRIESFIKIRIMHDSQISLSISNQSNRYTAHMIIFNKIGSSINRIHHKNIFCISVNLAILFFPQKLRFRKNLRQLFLQHFLNFAIILRNKICFSCLILNAKIFPVRLKHNLSAFFCRFNYFI